MVWEARGCQHDKALEPLIHRYHFLGFARTRGFGRFRFVLRFWGLLMSMHMLEAIFYVPVVIMNVIEAHTGRLLVLVA